LAHAFYHPVTGKLSSPIVEKPPEWPGRWAIGCSVCARHLAQKSDTRSHKPGAFAQFTVRNLTMMQGQEIRRHCKSELHTQAMADLQRAATCLQTEATTEVDAIGVSTSCTPDVPRPEKFVWAVTKL
jgi:hypothetical protein